MITRRTKGLTRSSQSRIQGFISICDKTSAFNESPSLRAVRLNQWHGVADGYAFGRWHKSIPGYFFQCCPRQRLQNLGYASLYGAGTLKVVAAVMLMFRRVGGMVKRDRMKRRC